MFGSFPGLKGHAVTLYEAGKLLDSSVIDMCEDLQQVEGTKMEGELQQFADHAFSFRHALESLRAQDASLETAGEEEAQARNPTSRVDVIRIESLQDLAPATVQRVLRRDYDVVVSMIPLLHLPLFPLSMVPNLLYILVPHRVHPSPLG